MERTEIIKNLNEMLLSEMPEYRESAMQFDGDMFQLRRLLRSLMNVRPPHHLSDEYIKLLLIMPWNSVIEVIFNVFTEQDLEIYHEILQSKKC